MCHYIFICLYGFLFYICPYPNSLFPIFKGIADTDRNSFNLVYWDTVIVCFTEGHQRTLFDFAVTNMTQRDDSKLVLWPFGDFDVDKAKD
ncbi:MAG: hypothetical protein KatS3mg027_0981 [Bacteroidia bacterium]|nr:MAG: hypothetical protein KatS3mg027_0981 [Bacteroidia bacterium]